MKRRYVAAIALLLSCSLSGCVGSSLPVPAPTPSAGKPLPALDDNRVAQIVTRTQKSLEQADASLDVRQAQSVLSDLALSTRIAEYQLHNVTQGMPNQVKITPLQLKPKVATAGLNDAFPRLAMAVTDSAAGQALPVLTTYVQDQARHNYRLWGYAALFPGVQVPSLRTVAAGTERVDKKGDLVMSPAEALAAYADSLAHRDGKSRKQFADDPLRNTLTGLIDSLAEGVKAVGKAEASYAPVPKQPIYALRTAEGGAIAMGALSSQITVQLTQAGAKLSLGDQIGALLQAQTQSREVKGKVYAQYLVTLAFYIPPQGAPDQQVKVLGATSILQGTSRDDAAAPHA